MSKTNRYIAQDAAVLKNPFTFTGVQITQVGTEVATIGGSIDKILTALAKEGTDPTDHRLFLDEMSPAARASMYRILTDLKASITVKP